MKCQVDRERRMILPKEVCKILDIRQGDYLTVKLKGAAILLEKEETRCVFCGNEKDLQKKYGQIICSSCLEKLIKAGFESDKK